MKTDRFNIYDTVLFAPDLKGARWEKGTIIGNNFDDDNTNIKVYLIKTKDEFIYNILADDLWIFPYESYMEYYIGKKVRSNDPRIIPNE